MFVPYIEMCEISESNWTLQIGLKHCTHVLHCNLEVKIEKKCMRNATKSRQKPSEFNAIGAHMPRRVDLF
jgi:hypothetical protein